jgi:hypothetical protein
MEKVYLFEKKDVTAGLVVWSRNGIAASMCNFYRVHESNCRRGNAELMRHYRKMSGSEEERVQDSEQRDSGCAGLRLGVLFRGMRVEVLFQNIDGSTQY